MINNKKIIAMIPARIGSQRVPKKNLRLIDGKPLISYVVQTINSLNIFDDIYINADDLIFKKIADELNVKFYHRDKKYASHTSSNDEFALDFMEHIEGDILLQVLPTSPLMEALEIENFSNKIAYSDIETLISVEHKQIASVYNGKCLNFDKFKKNPPSQNMEPIKAYATALMGWEYKSFKKNMLKYGCAYHGGDSKIDYFQLEGLSTLDIDNEEDFLLAESIINAKKQVSENKIQFYGDDN